MPLSSRSPFVFALPLFLSLTLSNGQAQAQLQTAGHQRFAQDDVGNALEAWDSFGAALAVGDFDGDDYDDLALGIPLEDVGGIQDAGGVVVIYGGPGGFAFSRPLSLHQDVSDVNDMAEPGDRFGAALAAGDLDGDGYDELIVGVPFEDVVADTMEANLIADSGAIHIFYGTPAGLTPTIEQFFTGNDLLDNGLEANSTKELGAALATGHVDADTYEDLLIGEPGVGFATLIHGSFFGATVPGTEIASSWRTSTSRFGQAVLIADVDDDGLGDLIVGAPFFTEERGAVWALGSLGTAWTHSGSDLPVGSHLGAALAAGKYYSSSYSVVAAAPDEQDGLIRQPQEFGDPHFDVPLSCSPPDGSPAQFARYGAALASVVKPDYSGGLGCETIAIGAPGHARGGTERGVVDLTLRCRLTGYEFLDSATFGRPLTDHDQFGAALATGDFNGDGLNDLAIGAPTATWNGVDGTGYVQIAYGSIALFWDGFETADMSAWDAVSP